MRLILANCSDNNKTMEGRPELKHFKVEILGESKTSHGGWRWARDPEPQPNKDFESEITKMKTTDNAKTKKKESWIERKNN